MKTCGFTAKGSQSDLEQSTKKPHVLRHYQKWQQSQRQKNGERQKPWSYLGQKTEQQTGWKFTKKTWHTRKPQWIMTNFHICLGLWKAVHKCKAAHTQQRLERTLAIPIFLSTKKSVSSKTILQKKQGKIKILLSKQWENSFLPIFHNCIQKTGRKDTFQLILQGQNQMLSSKVTQRYHN